MSDQILAKILETSFTVHQLRQKIRVLKNYLNQALYGGADSTKIQDSELVELQAWLQSLGAQFYQLFNQSNFQQTFDELEKRINTLPTLVIYFAIEPTQQQLQSVGVWLRSNYGAQFIFDSKYDPSLIAGCALVWKGVYKDYSLKGKIAQNRDQILEVIQSTISLNKHLH